MAAEVRGLRGAVWRWLGGRGPCSGWLYAARATCPQPSTVLEDHAAGRGLCAGAVLCLTALLCSRAFLVRFTEFLPPELA